MLKRFLKIIFLPVVLLTALFSSTIIRGQTNAEQVLMIGRNIMSMEDYLLAIQYFNQAIKAKPYLADPYFYRALAKLNLEDYQGAEDDCTLAIERNGYKPEAYKLRGFSRQMLGKDSLAILDYDMGMKYNPMDKYFKFYKGAALYEMKKYAEADTILNALFQQDPSFSDIVKILGHINLERGDTTKAMTYLQETIEKFPNEIDPYLMIAEIEWKRQNWEKAGEALDGAIKLKPDNVSLYINRAFVRYNSDNFMGAMKDYNKALELDPTNAAIWFNRALLHMEVNDIRKAKIDFSKVLEIEPNNFYAIYNRSLINMEIGDYKSAIADFKRIIKRYPRFYPAYYGIAEAESKLGNNQEAMRNYYYANDLIAKYVDNPKKFKLDKPVIQAAKSNEQKNTRRPVKDEETEEDVMEKFNQLITVSPSATENISFNEQIKGKVQDRDINVELAPLFAISLAEEQVSLKSTYNFFRELEELNHARLINEKFYVTSGLNSDNFGQLLPTIFDDIELFKRKTTNGNGRPVDYLAEGVANLMVRNHENAIDALNKAIALDPRFTIAYMARGFASYDEAIYSQISNSEEGGGKDNLLQQKLYAAHLEEALKDFNTAVSLNPRLIYAYFNIGNIYYLIGDTNEAIANYNKALSIDPGFGEAYFNLGLAQLKTGEKTAAFESLSKAGELGIVQSYNVIKRMK